MDLGIAGRNALVTGGSRGLGRETALSLAREGVNVAICGRTKQTLDGTVAEIRALGVSSIGIVADVSDTSVIEGLHSDVVEGLGPLDILVNNVGGGRPGTSVSEITLDVYKEMFDHNLFGGFQLTLLALPHMREQGWGRVINIVSIFGREYGGPSIGYMSSKAAVIAATKHAAVTLVRDGVTFNSIAPGSIEHPGGSWERFQRDNPSEVVDDFISRNLPMGKFGWPGPVADLAAFLASERADLITGACVVVDGGQSSSLI
jgi:3-oxoacyl-[acyl-carrier protein] reductase